MATKKQLLYFAFTSFTDNEHNIIKDLEDIVENYIFQLEKCPSTGNLHYQGRFKLKYANKSYASTVHKLFKGTYIEKARFSPEHDIEKSEFYCLKDDTKILGPWSDQKTDEKLRITVPWDLECIKEWRSWQTDVFASFKDRDDRAINILVDPVGGNGKSKVLKMALWKKWAGVIPCIGDAKDIIQAVCSMDTKTAYILDLPRTSESDKHLFSQIKAIEQIKNGVVMDFRYKYQEKIFGSPVIWVFTNHEIPAHHLSSDRWIRWRIDQDKLVRV